MTASTPPSLMKMLLAGAHDPDPLVRALVRLIDAAGTSIAPELLKRLAGVPDPTYDVMYYLEGDDRYDAGHDFVHEDVSDIRAAAERALAWRQ